MPASLVAFQALIRFNPARTGSLVGTKLFLQQQETDIVSQEGLVCHLVPSHALANDTIIRIKRSVDSSTLRSERSNVGFGSTVCRVVAMSDGKIPSSKQSLPASLTKSPYILEKLDAIFHAISHAETKRLSYMEKRYKGAYSKEEEQKLVTVLKNSLEDAGFELLSQRDLDLCDALNAGYLLRLSINPDVRDLDPGTFKEFYPEKIEKNQTGDVLFDGRVLVYRRGYSSEVTTGRLLLPKLDYLQSSLVQRSVAAATTQLGVFEKNVLTGINRITKDVRLAVFKVFDCLFTPFSNATGLKVSVAKVVNDDLVNIGPKSIIFKLARYGGRKLKIVGSPDINNELTPFLICEVTDAPVNGHVTQNISNNVVGEIQSNDMTAVKESNGDHGMYDLLIRGEYTCEYDSENTQGRELLPTTLLKRVSISSIVDVFTREGRAKFAKRFLSQSELVEPTFEEVVVVWRPSTRKVRTPRKIVFPRLLYDLAEVLDMENALPQRPKPLPEPTPLPLEIRAFNSVPMANLPAVLPKTTLVFRPADALVNDFISVATFALVAFSFKFDNPRLDLIAIISLGFWIFRTIIRYSNKLARYDLLVKKFLTSKIAHRDSGALKYITTEAGSQRALRAALVHSWLLHRMERDGQISGGTSSLLTRENLVLEGYVEVNNALATDQLVDINISAALNDLEDLQLIKFNGANLESVKGQDAALSTLKSTWMSVFDDDNLTLPELTGRRTRSFYCAF